MLSTAEKITPKIIELQVIDGGVKPKEPKLDKYGNKKRTRNNKKSGVSSEVYAFKSHDELQAVIDVLNQEITDAEKAVCRVNKYHTQKALYVAKRNKMLFLVGINIGIRASDIRELKWRFFLNDDLTFKQSYSFQPKKTKKTGKFVKLFFNDAVKHAVSEFIEAYPVESMDDYVFKGYDSIDKPITTAMMWKIMNDTAEKADITQNIGSHSLRKTFGYWCWHDADDKSKALVTLQSIFNHSTTLMTMKYIGIIDEDVEEMFNSLCLGYDSHRHG